MPPDAPEPRLSEVAGKLGGEQDQQQRRQLHVTVEDRLDRGIADTLDVIVAGKPHQRIDCRASACPIMLRKYGFSISSKTPSAKLRPRNERGTGETDDSAEQPKQNYRG